MKRMNLLLVCGLAATISSPTLAQTGNQPGQNRPGQDRPGQQQPGQDREQDRLTRPGQQGGQQDAQQILRQLEGSWHIEIKMDPKLFGDRTMGADRPRTPGQDRDWDPTRDREDPTQRDGADPTQRDQDDPTQRDRTQRPGQENRPGQQEREGTLGADQQGMVTNRGYSQNRLILDDKVLHEAAVIITSGEGEPGAAAQSGSDQVQALSFLGFDDQSQQYSFVIMTDRSGKFNCNHGEYDASSKKITFEKEGRAGMSGMRSGQGDKPKLDNVKIVLEIVSNDEHKVTMYDTSASSTRSTPGMRDQDREEDRTPGVQPGQRQQDRQQTQSKEGKIVYEATYTRAEGQPGQQPGQQDRMPGQQRPNQPGQQPGGGGGQ